MFCKWCGKTIQPTDRNCPACGRETPPLSDCGGLYNLKYAPGTPQPPVSPAPTSTKCPVMDKLEPKYARDRKASKKHHKVTMISFAVLLIAILLTAVLVLRTSSQLGQIRDLMSDVLTEKPVPEATDAVPAEQSPPADTVPEPDSVPEDTSREPIQAYPLTPEPHSFVLAVSVSNGEDWSVCTEFDFGNYEEAAKTGTTVTRHSQGEGLTVSFSLNEDTAVSLELISLAEEEYPAIGIKCSSGHPLFENQEFTYEWQYLDSDGKWTTVEPETLTQSNSDYTGIRYSSDWQPLFSFSSEPVAVRCNIQIQNDAGDCLTVNLGGISLTDNKD